jgi:uncharacterized protein YjaG (DUF416 family)
LALRSARLCKGIGTTAGCGLRLVDGGHMAVLEFREGWVEEDLEHLPPRARVAFAAACAERLLPAYSRFAARVGRGGECTLKVIMQQIWDDLTANGGISTEQLDATIDRCANLLAEISEGPRVREYVAGEDAVAAVAYALRCRRSGQSQEAAWAAARAYSAVNDYVITSTGLSTNAFGEQKIVLAHPVIQAELARQKRDLSELLAGGVTINELRERSKAESENFLPKQAMSKWQGLEEAARSAWNALCGAVHQLSTPSYETLVCPSCKETGIHYFYWRYRDGAQPGRFWMWCSYCRRYHRTYLAGGVIRGSSNTACLRRSRNG